MQDTQPIVASVVQGSIAVSIHGNSVSTYIATMMSNKQFLGVGWATRYFEYHCKVMIFIVHTLSVLMITSPALPRKVSVSASCIHDIPHTMVL